MGVSVDGLFVKWERARADVAEVQRRMRSGGDMTQLGVQMEAGLRTMNRLEQQILASARGPDHAVYLLRLALYAQVQEMGLGETFDPNWHLVTMALRCLDQR